MKNKINYTLQSRRDMDAIWDYISFELQNPTAAEHMISSIMDFIDQLELFAESGTLLSSISDASHDERFLVSGKYLIFYHISYHGNEIYIDRVLYGGRDYLRILFEYSSEEMQSEYDFSDAQKNPYSDLRLH